MKMEELKHEFTSFFDSVADGWNRLRESATGAVTRFKLGEKASLPAKADVDDPFYQPSHGWSILGGDVFEDEGRVVVRLEVPGMEKPDLDIEVQDGALIVQGEKRFERESTKGRYRVLQCAYGSFRRIITLPAPVVPDKAKANYKNGVLRIELPKVQGSKPRELAIKVE